MLLMIPAMFAAAAASAGAGVALYPNCSKTEPPGLLPPGLDLKVSSSIAGEDGTCYRVTGVSAGKPFSGAIFDSQHPAVLAYRRAMSGLIPPPPPPTPVAPTAIAHFDNFTGTNFHDGERVDLAKVGAKLIIVHFWDSASAQAARADAEMLSYLKAQYGEKGLEIIGVTQESSPERIRRFNDDTEAVWPIVMDKKGLAQKYGVSGPSEIFLLDHGRNVLVAGPHPSNLEDVIKRTFGLR
jgi:peroxiredoxin